jgi:hypothetical protein
LDHDSFVTGALVRAIREPTTTAGARINGIRYINVVAVGVAVGIVDRHGRARKGVTKVASIKPGSWAGDMIDGHNDRLVANCLHHWVLISLTGVELREHDVVAIQVDYVDEPVLTHGDSGKVPGGEECISWGSPVVAAVLRTDNSPAATTLSPR